MLHEFSVRLKEAREELGLNQSELAERVGVTSSNISRYERGEVVVRLPKVKHLASILGVDPSWLAGLTNVKEVSTAGEKRIPVVSRVDAGMPIMVPENIEGDFVVDDKSEADFCLRVSDNGIANAAIRKGDLLGISKTDILQDGSIFVMNIGDAPATACCVYIHGDTTVLRSDNDGYEPIVLDKEERKKLRILGKVVFCHREVL